MATTIIDVHPVTPVQAWQIEANQDIWTVMSAVNTLGYTMTVQAPPGTAPTVVISMPGQTDQIGGAGDWIIWGTKVNVYSNAEATTLFAAGS